MELDHFIIATSNLPEAVTALVISVPAQLLMFHVRLISGAGGQLRDTHWCHGLTRWPAPWLRNSKCTCVAGQRPISRVHSVGHVTRCREAQAGRRLEARPQRRHLRYSVAHRSCSLSLASPSARADSFSLLGGSGSASAAAVASDVACSSGSRTHNPSCYYAAADGMTNRRTPGSHPVWAAPDR